MHLKISSAKWRSFYLGGHKVTREGNPLFNNCAYVRKRGNKRDLTKMNNGISESMIYASLFLNLSWLQWSCLSINVSQVPDTQAICWTTCLGKQQRSNPTSTVLPPVRWMHSWIPSQMSNNAGSFQVSMLSSYMIFGECGILLWLCHTFVVMTFPAW